MGGRAGAPIPGRLFPSSSSLFSYAAATALDACLTAFLGRPPRSTFACSLGSRLLFRAPCSVIDVDLASVGRTRPAWSCGMYIYSPRALTGVFSLVRLFLSTPRRVFMVTGNTWRWAAAIMMLLPCCLSVGLICYLTVLSDHCLPTPTHAEADRHATAHSRTQHLLLVGIMCPTLPDLSWQLSVDLIITETYRQRTCILNYFCRIVFRLTREASIISILTANSGQSRDTGRLALFLVSYIIRCLRDPSFLPIVTRAYCRPYDRIGAIATL